MKRLLTLVVLLLLSFGATAQNAKNVLEIDQSTFRLEQTDVLKDVNIDPIKKDRSQRACARVKLRINRMTREEIDNIIIKVPGGMAELTKRVTAIEGNGIIFELTAKPQTRFYLHHDKYGDSNEVTVDLEGNKVYIIDAQLNLLIPITIATNVKNADVYLDGDFKGRTSSNSMCSIPDIVPGTHTIRIVQGAAETMQQVDVNADNFSFRIDVNTQSAQPQWAVFSVEPQNAMVFIDDKPVTNNGGVAEKLLQHGLHTWRVIADSHFEQRGEFTISGTKVEKSIKLVPDGATVTVSSDLGSEIWINGEPKGNGSWTGMLLSGTYIFEARKAGHRTTTLAQTITSSQPEQSYSLDAPKPIYGTVSITSTPSRANVLIDGKMVGTTPLSQNLLVGNHTILVASDGYGTWEQKVTIAENQSKDITAKLIKHSTTNSRSQNKQQYVILEVEPANAKVTIGENNGYYTQGYQTHTPQDGIVQLLLSPGSHSIEVSADDYQTMKGTLTVSNQMVREKITLTRSSSQVHISVGNNAEIWINNKLRGISTWEGRLKPGYYTIEARKTGYRTTKTTTSIELGQDRTINLVTPKPIYGSLTLNSNPKGGEVKIDGKAVGSTPFKSSNIMVGPHIVEVSKQRHKTWSKTIEISENQRSYANATMNRVYGKNGKEWNKFNLGIYGDFGYDLFYSDPADYYLEGLRLGTELRWRLFKFNSIFIPTIGLRYSYSISGYTSNFHSIGIPVILNLNYGRIITDKVAIYAGAGCEFSVILSDSYGGGGVSGILNIFGLGWRHHDFNVYINIGCLTSIGCKYGYYF